MKLIVVMTCPECHRIKRYDRWVMPHELSDKELHDLKDNLYRIERKHMLCPKCREGKP